MTMLARVCALIALVFTFALPCATNADIIELGDLNIIDDAGNPSDGLRYLDLSFSEQLSQAAAIANAQATYSNARLATPAEWDDLFSAAGVTYDGAETASDAFSVAGASSAVKIANFSTATDSLRLAIGPVDSTILVIWSDPDGAAVGSTYNYLSIHPSTAVGVRIHNDSFTPPANTAGWLIVSEAAAVPEPSSIAMIGLGLIGMAGYGWRRRRKAA